MSYSAGRMAETSTTPATPNAARVAQTSLAFEGGSGRISPGTPASGTSLSTSAPVRKSITGGTPWSDFD